MVLVAFVCPQCQSSAKAPLAGVAAGDAGIWVCDACGIAYQINIEFSPVSMPRAVHRSAPACRMEAAAVAG